MTGPLTLSSPKGPGGQIWALIVPVYAGGGAQRARPARIAHRLPGGGLDAMELVQAALGPDASVIGMRVRDGAVPVYTSPQLRAERVVGKAAASTSSAQLEFGQRRWD